MILATLLFCSLLSRETPYQGVVVNAKTRQPVPAATVQLLGVNGGVVTDVAGRFTLASVSGSSLHLRVSSLGYAPTELTRPLPAAAADTILLNPTTEALPDVTVRPRQELTLQPFSKLPKVSTGYYLIPSAEFALELPPLAEGRTGMLSQVRLQFRPGRFSVHQGGLRMRLLARPDTTKASALNGPSGKDLLPAPITLSAVQIAAAANGAVSLDLSKYNLAMPATGLFVVLEGIGLSPEHQYVSITQPSKGHSALLVTGTDPKDPKTYEVTKLEEYPQLAIAESADPSITWSRGSNGKGWRLRKPNGGGTKVGNAMIAVVVMPD